MASCAVVGGGPAGMVLGLLLARCGIEVTVLEKHADFLRDFRGDTVHASTLTLLDQLGLGPAFAALAVRYVSSIDVALDSGVHPVADLTRLPGNHRHLALVPQWDLLDLLAEAAEVEPTFTLLRDAEVTGLRHDGDRVSGVTYTRNGESERLDADLVLGCDGRGSVVRAAAGLSYRRFGVPMDVLWFRLTRRDGDPAGGFGRITRNGVIVLIDRGDYFQVGFVIPKGGYADLQAAGIDAFRQRLADALPWLEDRTDELGAVSDLRLLDVQLGRLRRWWSPRVLCLGDAAHAMSPVGGVGINLAVQDAVAAARLLAPALSEGPSTNAQLAAVQRRRWWPTALTQTGQRMAHRLLLARALQGRGQDRPTGHVPLPLRVLQRWPALQVIPAYLVAIGIRPERPPATARRDDGSAAGPAMVRPKRDGLAGRGRAD